MDTPLKTKEDFKEATVDQSHGSGMVLYNYNPVDGTFTQASNTVQVEIGNLDIARQLGQQLHIQYGCLQTIQSGQPQIIVAQTSSEDLPSLQEQLSQDQQTPQVLAKVPKPRTGRSNATRVPCPHCEKTFSCNANLRDHIRLHTGERPFICSECGLTFAQRSNWRLHKRVHTGERPYMCGICGKTFSRSSHLPGHVRVHTGERPFKCKQCDQSFASAQALKNHVRTHTGEKPFICDVCQTPFTHSSSLSSHRKRCTGQMRKRGRPLGPTKKIYRQRGRPKKKGRLRQGRKSKVFNENVEIKNEDKNNSVSYDGNLPKDSHLKFNTEELTEIDASQVVEISVGLAEKPENEDSNGINRIVVKPNENEGLSILPDDGQTFENIDQVVQDVEAAVAVAGYEDNHNIKQEAALTMTTFVNKLSNS